MPLENDVTPSKYILFNVRYIIHQKITYNWADMTPILSFTTIIPLSMENIKKVLHPRQIWICPL